MKIVTNGKKSKKGTEERKWQDFHDLLPKVLNKEFQKKKAYLSRLASCPWPLTQQPD